MQVRRCNVATPHQPCAGTLALVLLVTTALSACRTALTHGLFSVAEAPMLSTESGNSECKARFVIDQDWKLQSLETTCVDSSPLETREFHHRNIPEMHETVTKIDGVSFLLSLSSLRCTMRTDRQRSLGHCYPLGGGWGTMVSESKLTVRITRGGKTSTTSP